MVISLLNAWVVMPARLFRHNRPVAACGYLEKSVGLYRTGKRAFVIVYQFEHKQVPRRCEFTTIVSKTLPLQGSAGFSSPETLCPAHSPANCQRGAELRKKRPIKPAGEVGGRRRAHGKA